MVVPGTLFEEFGFNYIGPIDGHDIHALVETLRNMRNLKGPQLLHVKTKKGKGYEPAEKDPIGYHAVPKFNPDECALPKNAGGKPTFSAIFGQWLCDMAAKDERLVGITPAMREGSGLVKFSQQYPDRYFDVAIAEQHAVTFAAGLAIADKKPVVAIYSSFLQRAYDQLIHDVALQNLPVLFAIDRAGLVGADGPTHQGAFDISFLRTVPNMVVMTPSDENECRQMLYTGYQCNQPAAVRYPRGSGCGSEIMSEMTALALGKGRVIREGKGTAILAFGTLLHQARAAAEALDATLVDMRFVKPMDEALVLSLPPPRSVCHSGRQRHHGRGRLCGERAADACQAVQTCAQPRFAGSLRGTRHPGGDLCPAGAGCHGHSGQHRGLAASLIKRLTRSNKRRAPDGALLVFCVSDPSYPL